MASGFEPTPFRSFNTYLPTYLCSYTPAICLLCIFHLWLCHQLCTLKFVSVNGFRSRISVKSNLNGSCSTRIWPDPDFLPSGGNVMRPQPPSWRLRPPMNRFLSDLPSTSANKKIFWTVFEAQLVEWLLPTPEVRSSNLGVVNFYIRHLFVFCQLY